MELTLPLVAVPAVIALVIKAIVFVYTRLSQPKDSPETRLFFLLIAVLVFQDVTEIYILYVVNVKGVLPYQAWMNLDAAYMLGVLVSFLLAVRFALRDQERLSRTLRWIGYAWLIVVTVLLRLPAVVSDVAFLDYGIGKSIISVRGPLYRLYEAPAEVMMLAIPALALYGWRRGKTARERARNLTFLMSFTPAALIITASFIQSEVSIAWFNAPVTIPLAVTFSFLIRTWRIYRSQFLDIELSVENLQNSRMELAAAWQRIQHLASDLREREKAIASLQKVNRRLQKSHRFGVTPSGSVSQDFQLPDTLSGKALEQYVAELETSLIMRALRQAKGNKSAGARLLGLKPNTLHYKMERYGLNEKIALSDTPRGEVDDMKSPIANTPPVGDGEP